MKIIPLGINGYIPSFGRHTMSFLLLTAHEALLLDAGTGVSRLLEPHIAEQLQDYEHLNIFLSHYHLDHIVGLSFLMAVWPEKPLRIYAPHKPFVVGTTPAEALNTLLNPPIFALPLSEFPMPLEIIPLKEEHLQISDITVTLRAQMHPPGGSMGIRIGDHLAYITDTIVDPATTPFVGGVNMLLHEVWLTDDEAGCDPFESSRHAYAGGVVKIATEAGVGRLMPVHHQPSRSNDEVQSLVKSMQEATAISVIPPQEGVSVEVE